MPDNPGLVLKKILVASAILGLSMACEREMVQWSASDVSAFGGPGPAYSDGSRAKPFLNDGTYFLGSKDVLFMRIQDHPEFSGTMTLDKHGEVILPVLDIPVKLEGLTLEQAEEAFASLVSPYVVGAPAIRIELSASFSKFIWAVGEVPGNGYMKVPMGEDPMTLDDLFVQIRPLDTADLERVQLIIPQRSFEDRPRFANIDLSGRLRGWGAEKFFIQPGTIVYVPPTWIARVDKVVDKFLLRASKYKSQMELADEIAFFWEKRLKNNLREFRDSGDEEGGDSGG